MKNTYTESTMKEAKEALTAFVAAAINLNDKWHDLLDGGYPSALADFEELTGELQVWEGEVAETLKEQGEDEERDHDS